MPTAKEPWTMPTWMEPYRDLFTNTGGNDVDDLITRFRNDHNLSLTNMPVYTLAAMAYAQVQLLGTLHEAGLLPPDREAQTLRGDRDRRRGGPAEPTAAELAARYWDETQHEGLRRDGIPDDALAGMRSRYIAGAVVNPEAVRQIGEFYTQTEEKPS